MPSKIILASLSASTMVISTPGIGGVIEPTKKLKINATLRII
jgi:hypothetical protein